MAGDADFGRAAILERPRRGIGAVRENLTRILALRGEGIPVARIFEAMGGREGTGVSRASFESYVSRLSKRSWVGRKKGELTPLMRETMFAELADPLGGRAPRLAEDEEQLARIASESRKSAGIDGMLIRRFCEIFLEEKIS